MNKRPFAHSVQRATVVFVAGAVLAAGAHGQTLTFDCATSSGTNCSTPIPDPVGGVPQVISSSMLVSSLCGPGQFVSAVAPRLDVSHPWVGDLHIVLVAPAGGSTLVVRPLALSGGCSGDDIVASFQDGAPPFACSATSPANGVDPVAPESALAGVASLAAPGTWSLQMTDFAPTNAGALNGWSLTFTCSDLNVVSIVTTDPVGNEAGDEIGFTVTRTGATPFPLNVNFAFSGTATSGADYFALSFTIPAGQSSANFPVTPLADAISEGSETVIATIEPSPAYVVGSPSSATGIIVEGVVVPTLSPLGMLLAVALLAGAAVLVLRRGIAR